MDSKSKQLPGWEKYQSRQAQQDYLQTDLGMFDPMAMNPSEQELSQRCRMVSKMTAEEAREMGNEPLTAPQLGVMILPMAKRRKK
jgi:hypothetical protein